MFEPRIVGASPRNTTTKTRDEMFWKMASNMCAVHTQLSALS